MYLVQVHDRRTYNVFLSRYSVTNSQSKVELVVHQIKHKHQSIPGNLRSFEEALFSVLKLRLHTFPRNSHLPYIVPYIDKKYRTKNEK